VLRGRDIVVLALPRWDGPYESASFSISVELAKHNRVLYVDHPFTITEVARGLGTPQIRRRLSKMLPFSAGVWPLPKPGPRMWVLTPAPTLPINALAEGRAYDALSRLGNRALARRIRRAIQKLGFRDYIFINSFNFHYGRTLDHLSPALSVYHCVDAMIKPYTLRHGPRLEGELLEAVDLVITTSAQLMREKARVNRNTHCIPNAARFDVASRALDPGTPIPSDIAALGRPVIGYFGNIERRIDYDLVLAAAAMRPDWRFVLVGPIERAFVPDALFGRPNVHLLGRKPHETLPGYLKAFDVAIIPFKVDAVSATIYPLKFFEYLGAGRPVVTTPFNMDLIEPLAPVVSIATTAEEFVAAVESELAGDAPDRLAARMAAARENTWDMRGQAFAKLLYDQLAEKEARNEPEGAADGIPGTERDRAGAHLP